MRLGRDEGVALRFREGAPSMFETAAVGAAKNPQFLGGLVAAATVILLSSRDPTVASAELPGTADGGGLLNLRDFLLGALMHSARFDIGLSMSPHKIETDFPFFHTLDHTLDRTLDHSNARSFEHSLIQSLDAHSIECLIVRSRARSLG